MHKHIICIKIHKVLYFIFSFIFVQEVFTKMLQGTFCNTSFLCKTAQFLRLLCRLHHVFHAFTLAYASISKNLIYFASLSCSPLEVLQRLLLTFILFLIYSLRNEGSSLHWLQYLSRIHLEIKKCKTRTRINICCAN